MRFDGKTNAQTVSELTLNKLSVVKNPAQAPALAAIIKSISEGEADKNIFKQTFMEALHEITLDEQVDALMNTMWDLSWALRKSIRDTVHDEGITNKKEVVQGNISAFAASMSTLVSNTNIIKTEGMSMKKEEIDALIKKALEPVNTQLGVAQNVIKMDVGTRAHFDALSTEGQAEFLKMSAEDQVLTITKATTAAAEIVKAASADESLTMHGQTIQKSTVGEGIFNILKAQQAEIETGKTTIAKEIETREIMEFTKQAEGLYPNLPGESLAKGKVMKTIAGLDTDIRETLTGMLKSGNEGIEISKSFVEIGDGSVVVGDVSAVAKLNKMAEDKAATEKITFHKAYSEILDTPEGADLYEKSLKK